jgi:hypothetical protein
MQRVSREFSALELKDASLGSIVKQIQISKENKKFVNVMKKKCTGNSGGNKITINCCCLQFLPFRYPHYGTECVHGKIVSEIMQWLKFCAMFSIRYLLAVFTDK